MAKKPPTSPQIAKKTGQNQFTQTPKSNIAKKKINKY